MVSTPTPLLAWVQLLSKTQIPRKSSLLIGVLMELSVMSKRQ